MTDAEKQGLFGQLKHYAGGFAAVAVLVSIIVGPPAYVLYQALTGVPLYTTKTVTTTVPSGLLVESGGLLMVWFLFLFIGYGMATGLFPRAPGGGY